MRTIEFDQTEHLVLVGLMATGKTTVGRLAAARLGRTHVDSDELIELRTGRTVREIFADDGEATFRELEAAALVDALAEDQPAVISAAGGVVLDPANRRALRDADAFVVWLRADPELLAARVGAQDHRPLLDDDPAGTLAAMDRDRAPLYAEVADRTIDVDGLGPDEVLARILSTGGDR